MRTTESLAGAGIIWGAFLDDFSRYIIAWKIFTTMAATDVKELLDRAVEKTGIHEIPVGIGYGCCRIVVQRMSRGC